MNFRHILTAAALAAAFYLAAQPVAAQRVPADTMLLNTALWTGCPGMTLRVAVASADTVTGRCGPVADGRLTVRTENGDREVQLTDVRTLAVRKSRMAEAALLLSVAGALVGQAVSVQDGACSGRICLEDTPAAERGLGAATGAVLGAAAGLLLGSRFKYWQNRYP